MSAPLWKSGGPVEKFLHNWIIKSENTHYNRDKKNSFTLHATPFQKLTAETPSARYSFQGESDSVVTDLKVSSVVWDSAQGAHQFPISLRMPRESAPLRGWKAGGRKELQGHTTIRVQYLTNGCTPTNSRLPHQEVCISATQDVMTAEPPSWPMGLPNALHLTPTLPTPCAFSRQQVQTSSVLSAHIFNWLNSGDWEKTHELGHCRELPLGELNGGSQCWEWL